MSRKMRVNSFAGTGEELYTLRHEWPDDCRVQGGHNGVVLRSKGENYRTAYFEAFPQTFIRGEGETLEEAEDAAWEKFMRRSTCPAHEYESRGYKNGAGFCKHCNNFKSGVFTGEDLGQYCETCGAPTTHQWIDEWFFCEDHPAMTEHDIELEMSLQDQASKSPEQRQDELSTALDSLFTALAQKREQDER